MYDDRPSILSDGLVLLFAWLMAISLGAGLANFWHIDRPPQIVLGSLVLAAVLMARWPWLCSLLVPLGAGIYRWAPAVVQALYLDFTVWFTDLRLGYWPVPEGSLAWAALLLTLLPLAALFVWEPLAKGRALWCFVTGTALFSHMWLWGDDVALKQYAAFLLACLPQWAFGMAAARNWQWFWAGRRVVEGPGFLAPAFAGVLLMLLAVFVFPAPDRGVELGGLTAWVRATFPGVEAMRGDKSKEEDRVYDGFSIATIGFARRLSELGGPVKPEEGTALNITFVDAPPVETLYLRGNAMTNYNGRGFVTETRSGSAGAYAPPTVLELTIDVRNTGLNTQTLFHPRELAEVKGTEYRYTGEGQLIATKPLSGGPYRLLVHVPARRPGLGVSEDPIEYDPSRYVFLPKTVPARVAELTEELVRGRLTPFDKAVAIEEYLRTLPYAMDVPATPPGRDFVDYYLFDLKRGYCTYSATAMTVMLRTAGIPARWVQGFAVEPVPGKTSLDVPYANAHAWVEAYFPGSGWFTFDPTPRFTPPERPAASADQAAQPTVPSLAPSVDGDTASVDPDVPRTARRGFAWVVWIALAAALAWVATNFRQFFRERIDWRDERRAIVRGFTLLLAALHRMGYGRQRHQTPVEYARAVGSAWPDVGRRLTDVAHDVTAALWARPQAPMPPQARRRMTDAMGAVWAAAERRWGWLRSRWMRFRFLWGKE